MSKIVLTEEQAEKLKRVWVVEMTHVKALTAVVNEAVAMGLVRPASDDPEECWGVDDSGQAIPMNTAALSQIVSELAARVAALEAKYETLATATLDPSDVDEPPDPHAAAKDRAKLWGVELVTLTDGTCLFMTEKHYLSNPKPSWFPHVFSFRSPHYSGGHKTLSDAWSNFPTEPPPGWEAKCERL